jgi:hypothetical protein
MAAARGRFIPKNPAKYIGNPERIVFRSSWELHFFKWLDSNSSILRWGSEELHIPYLNPIDGRVHRYFPDIVVLYKHKDGSLRKEIIEIKPYKETVETPKMTARDAQALAVNRAKWTAAAEFAARQGATFRVVTEKTLYLTNGITKRKPPQLGRSV